MARRLDVVDAKVAAGPHADFRMPVSLTATWLASTGNGGDVARADGFDIHFTADQAGMTPLAFEVERYNAVTGTLDAWVKIPSLSAATGVFLHYGDPAITTSQAMPEAVWSNNYALVAHMNGGGDSTTTNTLAASVATADGKIAGARSLDGTSNTSINAGTDPAIDDIFTGGGTVEVWFKADSFGGGNFGRVFDKTDWSLFIDNSNPGVTNSFSFFHGCSGGNFNAFWHLAPVTNITGAWHHLALVYNKSSASNDPMAYIDGASVAVTNDDAAAGTMDTDATANLYIGQRAGGDRGFDGTLDEVRLSSAPRGGNWIATQFANQSDPATFYTVSAPL